jgi:PBSX family phage terminase large subunit
MLGVIIMKTVNVAEFVPTIYDEFFFSVFEDKYSMYILKGGRGGVKSSIASLVAVITTASGLGDCACFRRYAKTLRDSCYTDCMVAAERLGMLDDFIFTTSPMKIVHKKTKCTVYFAGLDNPQKTKSLKSKKGFKFCWFEEGQEYNSMADLRTVIQTVARGEGVHCNVCITYNPPSNPEHFVNKELLELDDDKFILHINYTDVPRAWLGEQFWRLAEQLKNSNYSSYLNCYLGEVVGSEGLVFSNIRVLDESVEFDKSYINRGVDFGFATHGDPCCYTANVYDETTNSLFIFHEFYKQDSSHKELSEAIKAENIYDFTVFADSASPGSIKQLHDYGCYGVMGCKKPKDSIMVGIRFLQDLSNIYIDPIRCPETYREFTSYSWVPAKQGESTGTVLSPKNNHSIDATRYSLNNILFN